MFCEHKCIYKTVTPPPEVLFPATSEQPESNLVTIPPRIHGCHLLKNLGSSSRSARDRGGEPANHSETATFGPSAGKFKPRKFPNTDVVVRYADFLV
ncbi:hypothetical protein E2C01_093951 [Portunus trituberculatus]|uniref:Uncharacterized protein n=1 Tax=Portunus trituberculatus TaxID=210409 RepID=A0A5B7JZI5_PORTR|nr:hypothetical protein [Portunus trituberculatus]